MAMWMKLAYFGVIAGAFLDNVNTEHFELNDGQKTCILLDLNATFDLSMGTQKADPFTINNATVTSQRSLCGTETIIPILALNLFPTDEMLKITFRRDVNLQMVSMSVVLTLDPKKHFENATDNPFELENSADLSIGRINMSYKCNSEQQMFFNQDPGYSMTMKITNLQVQAYNIHNGTYSEAIECEQDITTPTVPTTTTSIETTTMEEPTTESPTTSTSPETTMVTEPSTSNAPETTTQVLPESTTSENSTVTEPTTTQPETASTEPLSTSLPKVIPKYELKDDNGTVCIVLQAEIKLRIQYKQNNTESSAVLETFVPENATVEGQCSVDGNDMIQEFNLTFFKGWIFSVTIEEDEQALLWDSPFRTVEATPSYSWKTVELSYVIDDHFDDPEQSEIGLTKMAKNNNTDYFKASSNGSYECSSGETIKLNGSVTMDFLNFHYRAFGKDNSTDFSSQGVNRCPADNGNDDDDDDDDTLAIVLGSVFGGLAFILLVVGAIVCFRRRKHKDYEVM